MTTEEGNKLIAEFIEYDLQSAFPFIYGRYGIEEVYKYLKYHSSWDWQIPAWRKFIQSTQDRLLEEYKSQTGSKYLQQFEIWEHNYHAAIDVNSPKDAFDILVMAIQWSQNQTENK